MSDRVIDVEGLHKSYGDVEAVKGVDLHVDRGEIFALLGPNGAGKTTTVEILEGFRTATAGAGRRARSRSRRRHEPALTERIGIVLQSTGVDPYLTVRETVELYSGYYPNPARRRGDRPGRAGFEGGHSGARSSPAGSSVAWTSRSRWRATRNCCSWTSRRPGSTPAHAMPRGTSSRASPRWARRSSSRRTSWTRRSSSPTGSRCWRRGRSSPRARRRRSLAATGCWRRIQFRVDGRRRRSPGPGAGTRRATAPGRSAAEDPTRPLHELTGWAIERGVTFDALEVTRPEPRGRLPRDHRRGGGRG